MQDAVPHLPGQVQPPALLFQAIDHAQALLAVPEPAVRHELAIDLVERRFAGVTERRVAEVVAERDRLGEVLIEPQRAGDGASDLRDFEGVGEARAIVVLLGVDEDLGLVLETAERLGVDDPVAVALEIRAHRALRLVAQPPARIHRRHRLRR